MSDVDNNLTTKASKSIFWSLFSSVSVSGLRFISTAILARILLPEEFGLIGMAMLVTGIIQLFGNFGLGAALIQKQESDQMYLSTAYWSGIFVGLFLTAVGVALAPLMAVFFHEPNVKWLVMVLSFNFILSAFSAIQAMIVFRDLRFKEIAVIEVFATICRIVVIIILALKGFSFWSIVAGILVERIIKTIIFIMMVPWKPKFIFSKEKFKELFHFGKNLYGASMIGYLSRNMDFLVTGRFLGSAELGFYQFSYNLPHLILSNVTQKINDVIFPIYSKVKDDTSRIARGYLKTVKYVALITFPLMVGLFYVADDFIIVVYSAKWSASILPLKILSLSAIFGSISPISSTLLTSVGRPDIGFKWNLILFPINVLAIIFGSKWGIVGVASAMGLLSLFSQVLTYIAIRKVNLRIMDYVGTLRSAIMGSGGFLLLLWGINQLGMMQSLIPLIRLFVNVALGGGIYLIILWVVCRADVNEFLSFAMKMFKKN